MPASTALPSCASASLISFLVSPTAQACLKWRTLNFFLRPPTLLVAEHSLELAQVERAREVQVKLVEELINARPPARSQPKQWQRGTELSHCHLAVPVFVARSEQVDQARKVLCKKPAHLGDARRTQLLPPDLLLIRLLVLRPVRT